MSIEGKLMASSNNSDFRPNEFVVYPAHGVGQIISIEEQDIAGTTVSYTHLRAHET